VSARIGTAKLTDLTARRGPAPNHVHGRASFGIIGELTHTWVTTDPDVAVNGYVCVILKTRAVEPFELSRRGPGRGLDRGNVRRRAAQ
jgi:hypothetical protein